MQRTTNNKQRTTFIIDRTQVDCIRCTDTNDILLSVEDLKVYFRSEDEVARAVDGVSFDVRREETVCLVGESGCGKTVTALSIMGLVPIPPGEIADGRVLFREKNLLDFNDTEMQQFRGNQIAMVFQEPLTSLNPVFTIGDQIGEAIQHTRRHTRKRGHPSQCAAIKRRWYRVSGRAPE